MDGVLRCYQLLMGELFGVIAIFTAHQRSEMKKIQLEMMNKKLN